MLVVEPRRPGDARRRGVALALLTGIALLLHAGFLGGLDWRAGGATAGRSEPAALSVRVLASTAAPAPMAAATEPAPQAVPPARAAPGPKLAAKPAAKPTTKPAAAATVKPLIPPVAAEPVLAEPLPAEPAPVTAAVQAETAAPPASEPVPPPTLPTTDSDRELPAYRTLIPPAVTLRYQMRRGFLQGTGELQWRPDGDRYEARLEARLGGITVLTQISEGGFDAAGVAPLRFTDQRVRGGLRAANFQREAGKISFSGPSVEYPLLIGSQDRLSWMIQLAAVLEAQPPRLQDSGKVVIHVVGARGDAKLWVFRFVGLEAIETGVGVVQAAKFVREAADVYDTRVEVWLDPQRHHLPARALLRAGPDDEGLELLLQDAGAVPQPAPTPVPVPVPVPKLAP